MPNRELVIYSGRNRPDLTPIFALYRQLSGVDLRVEKVYHHDVGARVVAERDHPRADLLLSNSQLANVLIMITYRAGWTTTSRRHPA